MSVSAVETEAVIELPSAWLMYRPGAPIARTENVCEPSVRPVSESGLVQVVQEPPSSLHSKVPASPELKEKLVPVAAIHGAGPVSIVVSGSVLSTRLGPTIDEIVEFVAASRAIARKSYWPSPTPVESKLAVKPSTGVESLAIVVQLPAPVGLTWNWTE